MTNQEPTNVSQGINYLGELSRILGDLQGITALGHELIQNADDAKDDSGKLSATRISFDVTDSALVVWNDTSFRETDFDRISDVASASKRSEAGDRTTGAFGIGFISVYQITDRPEIHSAGRRWIMRPEYEEKERIQQWPAPSINKDKGTLIKLPWAFLDSEVRQELRAMTVDPAYIETFTEELRQSLPKAILFLKRLERIELLRNGNLVTRVTRDVDGDHIMVNCDGDSQLWRSLKATSAPRTRSYRTASATLSTPIAPPGFELRFPIHLSTMVFCSQICPPSGQQGCRFI